MKRTNKQLDLWTRDRRQDYKSGKLSKKQIEDCESIKGWYWSIDSKQEAIDTLNAILDRSDLRGHLPREHSKVKQERQDCQWIITKRKAKRGYGKRVFYQELQNIAEERGYPDMFNTTKDVQLKICREILQRAKKRGCLPRCKTEDNVEKQDRRWIGAKRRAKKGRGMHIFSKEYDKIAKEYGFPDAFNAISVKDQQLMICKEVFERAKKRGSMPKVRSKNIQEAEDGRWIQSKKVALKNYNTFPFHKEYRKIAEEYGFKGVFDETTQDVQLKVCREIFERAKKRGCLPKIRSKDPQEVADGRWIQAKRDAKRGAGRNAFNKDYDGIAKKQGFPKAFESKKSLDIAA